MFDAHSYVCAHIAQMVEQLSCKQLAGSSSLPVGFLDGMPVTHVVSY